MNENMQGQINNQQVMSTQSEQKNISEKNLEKKKIEEFSLKWHLKVLAVIYVILGILYIILRIYLK